MSSFCLPPFPLYLNKSKNSDKKFMGLNYNQMITRLYEAYADVYERSPVDEAFGPFLSQDEKDRRNAAAAQRGKEQAERDKAKNRREGQKATLNGKPVTWSRGKWVTPRQAEINRARDGKSNANGLSDRHYDPKTGTTLTNTPDGRTSNRIFARRNGKPGFMIKGQPDSWQAAPEGNTGSQQAAQRHDIIKGLKPPKPPAKPEKPESKPDTSQKPPAPRPVTQQPYKPTTNIRRRPAPSAAANQQGAPKPVKPVTPAKPTSTSAPAQTPKQKNMDTWAKANPKLAAQKVERDRTRGTTSSTNPMMRGLATRAAASPKPLTRRSTPMPRPNAPKPPVTKTPTPTKSQVSSGSSARLNKALKSVTKFEALQHEVMNFLVQENYARDFQHAANIIASMNENHFAAALLEARGF